MSFLRVNGISVFDGEYKLRDVELGLLLNLVLSYVFWEYKFDLLLDELKLVVKKMLLVCFESV